MKKNYFKTVISVFTLCALLGIGCLVAYASTVYSNWKYFGPINGYYYQNRGSASKYTDSVQGGSTIMPQWGGTAPANYMAVQGRLFDSDNYLILQGNWYFNEEVSYGISSVTGLWDENGIYYGRGDTAAYNGDGYTHYLTYQSPNVRLP
ncbi:MAG TPA: hypothetical protein DDZ44_09770 [Syntrophomonas wolfei]|jgi:hypothetical protein|uniref:Uncharacterized protein n=1 Tax=Syntrophomonas wolfei TaxID=863 RepID=A0A354YXZ1_9FIRM|nr:hypothetical protein [Syntrophomonas wolfei]